MKAEVKEIGNRTEEGRLKIVKIEEHEKKAKDSRQCAFLDGFLTMQMVIGIIVFCRGFMTGDDFNILVSLFGLILATGFGGYTLREVARFTFDEKMELMKANALENEILATEEEVKVK